MQLPDDINLRYQRPKDDSSCSHCSAPNASKMCGRCSRMKYCNRDCQIAHWKTHKRDCISFKKEGAPTPLSSVAAVGPHKPDRENKEYMKKLLADAKVGVAGPDDIACSTCKSISKCISTSEKPMEGGGATASASFVCGNGHLSAVSDVRFSLVQDCNCEIEIHPINAPLNPAQTKLCQQLVSPSVRLLIVMGFGRFNVSNSVYYDKLRPILQQASIPYDVIQADNGQCLTLCLLSKKYSAVMFIHLDNKGFEQNMAMFEGDNACTLYHWICFGGKFVLHGEGEYVTELLQAFVGKPWHHCGDFYRRVKHACNRKHFHHFPLRSTTNAGAGNFTQAADSDDEGEEEEDGAATGEGGWILPKHINMKATTLCGVAKEDRLYNPKPGARVISAVPGFGGHVVNHDRTGIAFSPVGKGFVCYVGDVNAEPKTLLTIVTLLSLPSVE